MSACRICTEGAVANTDATRCVCGVGTFSVETADGFDCQRCPTGARCDMAGIVWDELETQRGYWREGNSTQFLKCVADFHCPGGTAGLQCDSGRTGPLCGSCLPGYAEWSDECIPCESAHGGYVVLFLVLSWIFVIVLHFMSQVTTGQMKVLFFFVQTAVIMLSSADSGFMRWLEFFNFEPHDSTSPICFAPLSPSQKIALSALVPFILALELAVNTLVALALHVYRNRNTAERSRFDPDPFIRTFCAIYILSYTQVSRTMFRYMNCVDIGGYRLVYAEPGIDCTTSTYKNWLVVVILVVVIYVLLSPLVLFGVLIKFRSSITDKTFARRWGVLFDPYKAEYYWWEVPALFRRSVFTAFDVILWNYDIAKHLTFVLLLVIFYAAHLIAKPFRLKSENKLESISLFVLVCLSLILTSYQYDKSFTLDALIFALTIVPTGLFIVVIVLTRSKRLANVIIQRGSQMAGRLRRSGSHTRGLSVASQGQGQGKTSHPQHARANTGFASFFDGLITDGTLSEPNSPRATTPDGSPPQTPRTPRVDPGDGRGRPRPTLDLPPSALPAPAPEEIELGLLVGHAAASSSPARGRPDDVTEADPPHILPMPAAAAAVELAIGVAPALEATPLPPLQPQPDPIQDTAEQTAQSRSDWEEVVSETGVRYFFNKVTGETRWDGPAIG